MTTLLDALRGGLRLAARPGPALPLYLWGLLLGLIQAWPALLVARAGLTEPLLNELAGGDGAAILTLFRGGDIGPQSLALLLWLLAVPLLAALYAAAYNFFSGGALAAWAGAQPYWAACRHTFWSFTGLGALLLLFAGLALTLGWIVGATLGLWAGVAASLALLQLASLLGEYARAIVVVDGRRDPARALRLAIGLCARRPGTLALGLAGFGLHAALGWLAGRTGLLGVGLSLALGQLFALLWVWLKLLRLGWAMAYVCADRATGD
jgi:hypothetical protein